jgi:hypothetical protein
MRHWPGRWWPDYRYGDLAGSAREVKMTEYSDTMGGPEPDEAATDTLGGPEPDEAATDTLGGPEPDDAATDTLGGPDA